ncbi:MAG: hypothetical protein JW808_08325, partial [Victivallales bacterium]|nr:hypothetical protein [Victivallales bacterium]
MRKLKIEDFSCAAVDLWMNKWLLLTAGTMDDCNMMTVAWGSIGCMWTKPFAQVVAKPQRHTRNYLESQFQKYPWPRGLLFWMRGHADAGAGIPVWSAPTA